MPCILITILAPLIFLISPLFPQQSKPETVALVFGPDPVRIEFTKTSDAERLYSELKRRFDEQYQARSTKYKVLSSKRGDLTEQELKTFAALTQALGTIGYPLPEPEDLSPSEVEMKRWRRAPLQKAELRRVN